MSEKRLCELFEEGSTIVGMAAEARMKADILKNSDPDLFDDQTAYRLERMSEEINTYRDRLNEICEEIERNGTFSEMASD